MNDDEVYEWGERPDDTNFIAPMVVAADPGLSLRAKGLMFYMLALPKGTPTNSTALASGVKEGRDAVRVALNELKDGGYLIQTRRKTATGFVGVTRLLPYGSRGLSSQAPNSGPAPVQGLDSQAPRIPALKVQGLDSQAPENPAPSLIEREGGEAAAATTSLSNHVGAPALDSSRQQQQDGASTESPVTGQSQIPWTLAHLLEEWFGVKQPEQQQAWMQAWSTAVSTNGEGGYDVETDLSAYLTRCREEKREAKPSRWLRFLIEDRLKFVKTQQHHDEVLEQRDNADGGEQWALRSLRQTPNWTITEGTPQ